MYNPKTTTKNVKRVPNRYEISSIEFNYVMSATLCKKKLDIITDIA